MLLVSSMSSGNWIFEYHDVSVFALLVLRKIKNIIIVSKNPG